MVDFTTRKPANSVINIKSHHKTPRIGLLKVDRTLKCKNEHHKTVSE